VSCADETWQVIIRRGSTLRFKKNRQKWSFCFKNLIIFFKNGIKTLAFVKSPFLLFFQKWNQNIGFYEKRHFFTENRQKSPKIVKRGMAMKFTKRYRLRLQRRKWVVWLLRSNQEPGYRVIFNIRKHLIRTDSQGPIQGLIARGRFNGLTILRFTSLRDLGRSSKEEKKPLITGAPYTVYV
jgi:hypothetical protein